MPLPTSMPDTAQSAYNRVVGLSNGVVSNLTNVRNIIVAGGQVLADSPIGLYQNLNNAQMVGLSIQGIEGLADYAKSVEGPDYDIDADFMNSIVACMGVTDCILDILPSDGAGGFVGWRKQADGSMQRATIPASDLAPLVPLIDAALATFAKAG